jgi:hypothetical protein
VNEKCRKKLIEARLEENLKRDPSSRTDKPNASVRSLGMTPH